MTGSPHAAASRNTIPSPSTSSPLSRSRHGMAKTSPAAYQSGRSSCGTDPARITSSATPPSRASRSIRGRAGPPPTSTSAAPGTRCWTAGQARASMSWPLRGISRETQTTTGRPTRPSSRRIRLVTRRGGEVLGVDGRNQSLQPVAAWSRSPPPAAAGSTRPDRSSRRPGPRSAAAPDGRPGSWPTPPRGRGWSPRSGGPRSPRRAAPATPAGPRRRTRRRCSRAPGTAGPPRGVPAESAGAPRSPPARSGTAGSRPTPPSPFQRDVRTTTSSGSSRDTTPWTKDWIPPCRGGKSFVTTSSRRGVIRLARSSELLAQVAAPQRREPPAATAPVPDAAPGAAPGRQPRSTSRPPGRTAPGRLPGPRGDQPAGEPSLLVGLGQPRRRAGELAVGRQPARHPAGTHVAGQLGGHHRRGHVRAAEPDVVREPFLQPSRRPARRCPPGWPRG